MMESEIEFTQSREAKRMLAASLIREGRQAEAIGLLHDDLGHTPDGFVWMRGLLTQAMGERDLSFAAGLAAIMAELRWGSEWYHPRLESPGMLPERLPIETLSVSKLEHDIGQLEYLMQQGVLSRGFEEVVTCYRELAVRISAQGPEARVQPGPEDLAAIGRVYNRIIHVRDAPRLERVFSGNWQAAEVERQYLEKPPGVVVIDDFLSKEALESLRAFCLESTVWNGNRFSFGRLGSFFEDGFNCPLLVQIAEDIRNCLPRLITDAYPLREIWGFKCGSSLAADATIHADFAAVNVNFWLTPEESNLDPETGGLVIYGVDAPKEWDFDTYAGRPDIIRHYLKQQQASPLRIPYRANRAIIFNSDLFHATDEVKFRDGYVDRRLNITMLYGDRANDQHYQPTPMKQEAGAEASTWRSQAFSRRRH